MLFAGPYQVQDWVPCDGRLLNVNDYAALFAILGTTYGGNGVTTFGIPDLRSRLAVGAGHGPNLTIRALGQTGGAETVTLTTATMRAPHPSGLCQRSTGDRQLARRKPSRQRPRQSHFLP